MNLKKHLEELVPELIRLRRDFHQHPELGFKEFQTQEKIIAYLNKTGIETRKIAKTGVKAILSGKKQGRTILLRSDMDALSVQEETGLVFQSQHKGVMHACGHDGHMAMLLVAAKLLANLKESIAGKIVFAFQPNEEDAGAYKMIEEDILKNPSVDSAFGCHLWNGLKTGTMDICDGPIMAASHYFTLIIKGRGGHAGFAHESIDPIFISSHIIQAVQAIQTRQINALHPVVVMFTRIQGGSNTNIIPGKVILQGSIRFLLDKGNDVLKKFERIVKDICRLHNANCDLEFKIGNHMLSNDPSMARLVRREASDILKDKQKVTSDIRTMAGEDFSEFANRVPSAYAFVGARNNSKQTSYPHHHPKFDIDEDALVLGTKLYVKTALAFLKENIREE
ncbi:MAG: amidohydrolase [Desulfobacula sp.]|jgi:amidohydrolase|nr:amidohydrolase [Desulfobacula sp.]